MDRSTTSTGGGSKTASSFRISRQGTAAAAQGAKRVLTVEGCLFGVTAFAITLTKRLVGELLRPAGGAYNVDAVLGVMVRGLEKELDERLEGKIKNKNSPSTPADFST